MQRQTGLKKRRKKLTAKFCATVHEEGEYLDYGGPVPGLMFIVGPGGNSKSWLLRYRFRGKRREMGLGSYPEVTLANARDDGGDARKLRDRDIDQIERRKAERRQQW